MVYGAGFEKSTLRFKCGVIIEATLDRPVFSPNTREGRADGETQGEVIYDGHVTKVWVNSVLQPNKKIPIELLDGAKGDGVVNGVNGDIFFLATDQTSVKLAGKIFGDRIRIEFFKRSVWGKNGV
jgi:hypothetical protein